jgi:hypothetical protein
MKVNREISKVARKLYGSGIERKTIKKWVKHSYNPFSKFLGFRRSLEIAANKLEKSKKEEDRSKEYIKDIRLFLSYLKLKDLHYFVISPNNHQYLKIKDYNLKPISS